MTGPVLCWIRHKSPLRYIWHVTSSLTSLIMYEENVIHCKEGEKSIFFLLLLLSSNPLEWVITQHSMFDVTFHNWTSKSDGSDREKLWQNGPRENTPFKIFKRDSGWPELVKRNRELNIYSAYFIFRVINALSESSSVTRISSPEPVTGIKSGEH